MITFYQYPKCSTCKKAQKFLDQHNIPYKEIDISEKSPSKAQLKKMLGYMDGNIRKLFNTSGKIYREKKISTKLETMTEKDALELLASEGMLVKRPFLLTDGDGTVGFQEERWKRLLK